MEQGDDRQQFFKHEIYKQYSFQDLILQDDRDLTQWTRKWPGRSCSAEVHPQSLLLSSEISTYTTQRSFAARLTLPQQSAVLMTKCCFEALGGHVITLYVRELLKANSKCAAAQLVFMHLMCVGCPAVPVQPANKSW